MTPAIELTPKAVSAVAVDESHGRVHTLALRRWKVAIALTLCMVTVYFGFVAGVAFQKKDMGTPMVDGLSYGMVMGAGVILFAFGVTALYAWWANTRYDTELESILTARTATRAAGGEVKP